MTYECLLSTNLQSSNNSTERAIQSNTLLTLLKHAKMQGQKLETEFLNRFYSTRRVVNMMELTNTKQRKGEPVINYINRWRALSLDCKDKLTELSAMEMCTQEQPIKVDDPNYCKYHQIISHPVEKCFVLKELILKIELDIDEVAQTNHVAIKMTSRVLP
ncbi:ty3-gypsy retrotransposon protein [Cucumis melo var. makuwa]|uniref:Ty3-gypsy retrotransposon protein n=1 Tax=Cucumis melo var. makuwa TaxID=1194695 RepID=A0A5D3CTR3_CUCMM|nr:ty3-gypsy retrotransposon protein [Cucumis melo var. makuwa]